MVKKIWPYILILLLTLPAVFSLLHPGFFPSDDGEWMVIRLTDFHRSFVSGQIPVRWAARLNFAYGYPVFNFLYPLSLYLGEFFHLLGFSFIWSIKLVFVASFFFSGIFMYFLGRKLWGIKAGLVCAIFYTYAPYRFLDVYVRGSIGEALGFVFIPLIFWAVLELSEGKTKPGLTIGAVGIAGLVAAHNILAMIFAPIILLFSFLVLVKNKQPKKLFRNLVSLLFFSLGLSCFFWWPALHDKRFIILDQVKVTNYWEHFPTVRQLIIPSWGYGPSLSSLIDKASYQIGLLHLLAVGYSLLLLTKKNTKDKSLIWFMVLVFIFALLLMLSFSRPIWDLLKPFSLIQFPWRILSVVVFATSVLAGLLPQKIQIPLLALAILLNFGYARPEYFVNRPEEFYSTNEATTTVKDEYLPIWVREKPIKRAAEKVEIINGTGKIGEIKQNSKNIAFEIMAKSEVEVQLNTVYFPGWRAKIDGENAAIDYQNMKGLINLIIPQGTHQILIEFRETRLRLWADVVSLVSVILLLINLARKK